MYVPKKVRPNHGLTFDNLVTQIHRSAVVCLLFCSELAAEH